MFSLPTFPPCKFRKHASNKVCMFDPPCQVQLGAKISGGETIRHFSLSSLTRIELCACLWLSFILLAVLCVCMLTCREVDSVTSRFNHSENGKKVPCAQQAIQRSLSLSLTHTHLKWRGMHLLCPICLQVSTAPLRSSHEFQIGSGQVNCTPAW